MIETFIRQPDKLTEINYHNTGSIHTLSTAWNLSTTLLTTLPPLNGHDLLYPIRTKIMRHVG